MLNRLAFLAFLFGVLQHSPAVAVPGVMGDFNSDGVVNAADYTVWRNHVGSSTPLNNSGGESPVNMTVYSLWKSRYGAEFGSGSAALSVASASTTVPEPTSAAICILAIGMLAPVFTRRRTRYSARSS